MARPQVDRVFNLRHAAEFLDAHDAIFEEPLPSSRDDQRFPFRLRKILTVFYGLFDMVLPHLYVGCFRRRPDEFGLLARRLRQIRCLPPDEANEGSRQFGRHLGQVYPLIAVSSRLQR